MQPSPSQLRNGDLVTEPSGQGAFAEAMRELIAELRPERGPQLRLLSGAGQAGGARSGPGSSARSCLHLRLVR